MVVFCRDCGKGVFSLLRLFSGSFASTETCLGKTFYFLVHLEAGAATRPASAATVAIRMRDSIRTVSTVNCH